VRNKNKKSILIILLAAFSIVVNAQLKSGYQLGVNLTTMSIQASGLDSRPEVPMGIHFGGFYEIPVKKHFSILSGFLFSSKGADYKIDTISYSLTPTYIEIPVNLSFNIGSKATVFSLFGGLYAARTIGGYKITSGSKFEYLKMGKGEDKDIRYFDCGIACGAGMKIKSYLLSVQYEKGFTDVSPSENMSMRNKVIGISITSLK